MSPLIYHLVVEGGHGILIAAAAIILGSGQLRPSPSRPGASFPSSTRSQRKAWRL